MAFCPKCEYDYVEGITRCPDCDVDLVDELPEKPEVDQNLMPNELVTIAKFQRTTEANIAELTLKSEGINCFVDGIPLIPINFSTQVINDIKLQVRKEDIDRAMQVLGDVQSSGPTGNWRMSDEIECDKPVDRAFEDAQRALGEIVNIKSSDANARVIEGDTKYWMNHIKIRVEVHSNGDKSKVCIYVACNNSGTLGAMKYINKFTNKIRSYS